MTEIIEMTAKQWGNSIAFIMPADVAEEEHIKVKDKVKFLLVRDNSALRESFGMLKGKLKISGQEFKDRARRELYND